MVANITRNTVYRVAIYCRLSKDDEQEGDSTSIQNQRDMLVDYVKTRSWTIHDIYIDDGYTGLNTERPAFQRMIEDVEAKRVNLVISKDLSRLGRNYLQTGYYMENFFPRHGVRYIAVNDGVDTLLDNNELVPFKNVINEFYSRDMSKKMKSAYQTRAKQGKFTGCLAPFGYAKAPDDQHNLVIDGETAWIVRQIFQLAKQGYGVQKIRSRLRDMRIPTPTWWNRKKGLRNKYTKLEKKLEGGEFIWDCTTIKEIIENPVYIGHIASQKAEYRFKLGWIGDKPPDDWVVVENCHEPLVDADTYTIANEKLKSRKRSRKTGEESIFAGIVKCPDCGKSLNLAHNNSKNKEKLFTCNTYRRLGKSVCSQHRIFYDDLYAIVLEDIRKQAETALHDENSILRTLESELAQRKSFEQPISKQIETDERRQAELEHKVERLYDDLLAEIITESNFNALLKRTQDEQLLLEQRIKDNRAKLNFEAVDKADFYKWVELIKKYRDIKELDKTILNELISKIKVHEKTVSESGVEQMIEICYNFIGGGNEVQMKLNL